MLIDCEGTCFFGLGQFSKALACFDRVLSNKDSIFWLNAQMSKARLFMSKSDETKAMQCYIAISERQNSPLAQDITYERSQKEVYDKLGKKM